MTENKEFNEIKLEMGLLAKDMQMTDRLCQRISDSIEKLQEINVNLMKMISLHEEKHEQHERVESDLKDDVKELHSRITTVNRELHERMNGIEKSLGEKLDSLRSEILTSLKQHREAEEKRNPFTEKFIWMLIGGAVAIGWFIGNVDLSALSTMFR